MICCKCDVLPATCRVHTVATAAWKSSLELLGQDGPARWFPVAKTSYWCHICYERHEDHGPHEVFDLESPSSSSEEDVGAAPSEHQCEGVAVSESSWQVEDAMSESSWHMQDDCSSTKSFNLTWQQVDEDAMSDTSSQCSFMMVTPGSLAAEHLHKHQPCDAAALKGMSYSEVLWTNFQGNEVAMKDAIARGDIKEKNGMYYWQEVCTSIAPALQEHAPAEEEHHQQEQPTSSSSSSSPAAAAFSIGKWQEQRELDIALALPLEEQLPSSSNSSSSSSSISNSAAVLAASAKKTKGFKNKKVATKPLQPIQEQPILAIPYQSPSGCLETMFINQEDDDAVAHRPCITHGLDHHPHCRDCVNYQFMLEKSQHAMAEQTALELSLDNSKIVGLQACSKHGQDFNQHCPTCRKICDLQDQWSS